MKAKLLLVLLISISTYSFAQTKEELVAKDFFWGNHDIYKKSNNIPDKWIEESAVIIYKNENYNFHKFGKKVTYTTSIRKRIKLLDKAAVKEFSEFSYKKRFRSTKGRFTWRKKGDNFVGIKIIKPDETELEIDIEKEAIEIDGETKIAIPNLEIGDIIDYYLYSSEPFKSTFAFGFDPVETTLSEEYPIINFRLFIDTENDFFINFNSFNDAPELKEVLTENKRIRQYELVATDIDKSEINRWIYPLVELPSYKFQVYFARSGKFEDRALAFLPKKENIIKKTVSKEEVLDLYDNRFKANGKVSDLKHFIKGKTFKSEAEKVEAVFYYMRHFYFTRFIEAMLVRNSGIHYFPFQYYGSRAVFIKDQKHFIRHFTEFLSNNKIDYDIIVGKKRYDGSIDELLIEENVDVLLKINSEKTLYASYFGPHTSINEYSHLLDGTEVYLLSKTKNRIDIIKKSTLPQSTYDQNESKREIELNINEDFSGISVTSKNYYKGYNKLDEQLERFVFTDYVNEDYKKYGTNSFLDFIKSKKKKAKLKKKFDALITKLKDDNYKKIKEKTESVYDLRELVDYKHEIIETGRYGLNTYLIIEEKFNIDNTLLKKAGNNHIFAIGKLMDSQIDLTEKQQNRSENIYMNYPRSYNYEIKFNIPEGYTVSGIDKLNKKIDNATGAFISTAKIEGSILTINTSKQYKHNYEPNSNWNLMVEFLDAANQFTNEKILLKKQN